MRKLIHIAFGKMFNPNHELLLKRVS